MSANVPGLPTFCPYDCIYFLCILLYDFNLLYIFCVFLIIEKPHWEMFNKVLYHLSLGFTSREK